MITIELYRLDVTTGTFARKAVISNSYTNLRFKNVLNGVGDCTFSLNVLNPLLTKENFIPYRTQIVIKENNNVLWFGAYSNFDSSLRGVAGTVTIYGYSYFHHLFSRNTDKLTPYSNTEQTQILRNLINLTQGRTNGNLGITLNSENTGITRDRTYEYKNIGDAFIQMSEVSNGMDFEFVPVLNGANLLSSVNLQFYNLRKGSVKNSLNPLRIGDLGNVLSFGFGIDDNLYNTITSEGAGFQDALISTYEVGALQTGYTRREKYYPQKDVSTQNTLDQNTIAYGNKVSTPRYVINCEIDPKKESLLNNISLGDTLNIDIDVNDIKPGVGDLIKLQGQARIVELAYQVDDQAIKTIVPKLLYRQ